MQRFIVVAVSILVLVLPAATQHEYPKAEMFGGYQFCHDSDSSLNLNGWNAALTGNVSRWFGVTADLSGSYKNGGHIYAYMFGPTIAAHSEHVTPFVHALFGGATAGNGSRQPGLESPGRPSYDIQVKTEKFGHEMYGIKISKKTAEHHRDPRIFVGPGRMLR